MARASSQRDIRTLAALVVVALAAAGCSGSSRPSAGELGAKGGTTELGDGVAIVAPAGALADGTRFELSGGTAPEGVGELGASKVVAVSVVAGEVIEPVQVTFADVTYNGDPADGAPIPIGLHQASDGTWETLPAAFDATTNTVKVEASSFSPLGYFMMAPVLRDKAADIVNGLTGELFDGATQPTCDGEDAARSEGWQIASDDGPKVKWCFGTAEGERIVKVTNASRYPREFHITGSGPIERPSGSAATRISDKVSQLAGAQGFVVAGPGETVTVTAGASSGNRTVIDSSYDGLAASLFQLQLGAELAATILTKAGLVKEKQVALVTKIMDKAVYASGCLDELLPPATNGEWGAVDTGAMLRSCLLPAAQDFATRVANIIIGPVISTVAWVLSGGNYLIDQIRGGTNYKVVVTAPIIAAPTTTTSTLADTGEVASSDTIDLFLTAWNGNDIATARRYVATAAIADAFFTQFPPAQFSGYAGHCDTAAGRPSGNCEMLLEPAGGGYALIVEVEWSQPSPGKVVITTLRFEGDAG